MGKRKTKQAAPVPQLRRHKRSARAYARFNGKDVPFGLWADARGQPDAEAKAKYDQFVAQWLARFEHAGQMNQE